MGLWIRVETNVAEHPKVIAFADTLGISLEEALGYIVRVWGQVAEHRPSGDLKGLSDAAVEIWARWRGEPGCFGEAFRSQFMTGSILHGWQERQGKLIERLSSDRRRKRPPLPHPRYVYVMRRADGLLKIGCSRNPDSRLTEVANLIGQPVTLVGMVPGGYDIEKAAHVVLAAYQRSGEWFTDCAPVRDHCLTIGIPLSDSGAKPVSTPVSTMATVRNVTDTEHLVASSDAREETTVSDAREGLTVAYEVACVVALNDANREHLAGQHPDEVPASGQVGLVQWEADGIPLDLVVRTIRETVARYRPTPRNRYPRSLKYFDAAVRDAHECTRQRAAPSAAAGRPVVRQDADGVTRVVAHG